MNELLSASVACVIAVVFNEWRCWRLRQEVRRANAEAAFYRAERDRLQEKWDGVAERVNRAEARAAGLEAKIAREQTPTL